MKKLTVLAIVFLLLPAFSAGAASATHRKHGAPAAKARASEPAPAPTPPVTRLPIAPDTFRA
jgi:curli biogenesis system outer membrane secretion channel CsgG